MVVYGNGQGFFSALLTDYVFIEGSLYFEGGALDMKGGFSASCIGIGWLRLVCSHIAAYNAGCIVDASVADVHVGPGNH